MKRTKLFLMTALFALAIAVPMFAAQDPVDPAPSLDPTQMEAILVLVAGGVVTLITAGLKKLTGATGVLARILTGVIAIGATAIYFFFISPPFVLVKFLLYAVAIFGEATGYYHFYQKKTPTA
jgi:hypothetical protein